MSKHKRTKDLVRPMSPRELHFILDVWLAAAELRTPIKNPDVHKVGITNPDGSVDLIHFTDTPNNRGMFAVKEQCQGRGR